MPLVETSLDAAVGTVTMNHPERRNALSQAPSVEILAAFDVFRAAQVRAVILAAAPGTKTWCAGHDIGGLPQSGRDPLGWGDSLRVLVRAIPEHPAPVLAHIERGVWGGGCRVALACDIRIATPESRLALAPVRRRRQAGANAGSAPASSSTSIAAASCASRATTP